MKKFSYENQGGFLNRVRHKKLRGIYRYCSLNFIEALFLIHQLFQKYSIRRFFITFEEKSTNNSTRNMHVFVETYQMIQGVQWDGSFNLTLEGKTFVGEYQNVKSTFATIYELLLINSEWYASKIIHTLVEEHLGIRSGVKNCYFPEKFVAPSEKTRVKGARFLLHYTNIPAKTGIRHLVKLVDSNLGKYDLTECTINYDYSMQKFSASPFDIYVCFRVPKVWNIYYSSFLKRCTLYSSEKHIPVRFKVEKNKLLIHTKLIQQDEHLIQPKLCSQLIADFERKCNKSLKNWSKKNHCKKKP